MSLPTPPRPVSVLDWGRTDYAQARTRQDELVAARIDGRAGDSLVFTEHNPVYTIGLRAGTEAHLLWDSAQLDREGIQIEKTNRGGDITYHGPGQLVGYPIIGLAPRRDLHAYLRFIEQVLIDTVAEFGLEAARREGKTGIWIETRKIAAIGVAVRRWVAYHGFALNVNANLFHFQGIIPCGIDSRDGTVTSLFAELGQEVDMARVKSRIAAHFEEGLGGFLEGA